MYNLFALKQLYKSKAYTNHSLCCKPGQHIIYYNTDLLKLIPEYSVNFQKQIKLVN